MQEKHHILAEDEIEDGIDELGVLLFGHGKNAYWYGSQLSVEETRRIAPYQNATGMQVTSAVLAGMVWALENPNAGITEADEMDYRRCLERPLPYPGPVLGACPGWPPADHRSGLIPHSHAGRPHPPGRRAQLREPERAAEEDVRSGAVSSDQGEAVAAVRETDGAEDAIWSLLLDEFAR